MNPTVAIAGLGFAGLLLLGGCGVSTPAPGAAPGAASASFPSGNSPNDHTTAATGFGLGPEDFKSNGGAFGPDEADPAR